MPVGLVLAGEPTSLQGVAMPHAYKAIPTQPKPATPPFGSFAAISWCANGMLLEQACPLDRRHFDQWPRPFIL